MESKNKHKWCLRRRLWAKVKYAIVAILNQSQTRLCVKCIGVYSDASHVSQDMSRTHN